MLFRTRYNVLFRQVRLLTAQAGSIPAAIRLIFKNLNKLDIENPIIRINTAFKGCSSLEKISVLPRIYHN